jgi:hypothetical protein
MGWVVNATPRPLYPPGMTRYSLYRRLGRHQGWSGRVQKIWPPPGFDPPIPQRVAVQELPLLELLRTFSSPICVTCFELHNISRDVLQTERRSICYSMLPEEAAIAIEVSYRPHQDSQRPLVQCHKHSSLSIPYQNSTKGNHSPFLLPCNGVEGSSCVCPSVVVNLHLFRTEFWPRM